MSHECVKDWPRGEICAWIITTNDRDIKRYGPSLTTLPFIWRQTRYIPKVHWPSSGCHGLTEGEVVHAGNCELSYEGIKTIDLLWHTLLCIFLLVDFSYPVWPPFFWIPQCQNMGIQNASPSTLHSPQNLYLWYNCMREACLLPPNSIESSFRDHYMSGLVLHYW